VKSTYISGIKREYLKDRVNELSMNSRHKNTREFDRGINELPRNNLVKHENVNLPEVYHNTGNMWKKYFSQLLNVHSVSDVRRKEVHTAEQLVTRSSHLEVEIAFAKLNI
jgi:hypothetical protein